MKRVVKALNPQLDGFEASCFDGVYITGDVSARPTSRAMEAQRRSQARRRTTTTPRSRLALQSAAEAA